MSEEEKSKEVKKVSEKVKQIVIIRIRGSIKMHRELKNTFDMFRLYKRNYCVVVSSTPSILGMIQKVKDYITWGEINDETLKLLR
ncbi:MAG: uL30 family ribosomal protein, partial [Flavobacteriaceae bacterium]|nr:uL30 family ribosomal protein [Flavobacteriaceae bacterium]